MIPFTAVQSKLDTLAERLEGTGLAEGGGEGFLEALLGTLPPEAQQLTAVELVAWLEKNASQLLPGSGAPLPTEATAALPAEAGRAGIPTSPEALLGLIMSGRGDAAAAPAAARDPLAVLEQGGALLEKGDAALDLDGFPSLLQTPAATPAVTARAVPGAEIPGFHLRTPVHHPEFGQQLGERLTWLVRNELQQAKIHLDPPHLGPLEIAVAVKDDRASVTIHAHHAVTRDVLETEMPRLRGLLGDAGFAAVDVNVARDNGQQFGRQAEAGGIFRGEGESGAAAEEGAETAVDPGRGLVDHYA